MVAKKSAAQLREAAKELMIKAKNIEEKEFVKIGKVVKKYLDSGFKNIDFETLKKELKKVLSSGKDAK